LLCSTCGLLCSARGLLCAACGFPTFKTSTVYRVAPKSVPGQFFKWMVCLKYHIMSMPLSSSTVLEALPVASCWPLRKCRHLLTIKDMSHLPLHSQ
jgi:hypothetical protein